MTKHPDCARLREERLVLVNFLIKENNVKGEVFMKKNVLTIVLSSLVLPGLMFVGCNAHKHTLTLVDAVAPTCTTEGNTAYYKCDCGEFFSDAEGTTKIEDGSWVIDALGHNDADEDGVCDNCPHGAEVSVGDKYYATFEDAISNAVAGDIITLLKDVTVEIGVSVEKALTLDLNGFDIVSASTQPNTALIKVDGTAASLVITGNGTINSASQGNDYSMALWARNGGKITINGGTYTNLGAKSMEDATTYNNNELIYASGEGSSIEINGGTFIGNTENEKYGAGFTLNQHDATYNAGKCSIVVKGGTFVSFNPADNASEGANTNLVADGYVSVAIGENFVVMPEINN